MLAKMSRMPASENPVPDHDQLDKDVLDAKIQAQVSEADQLPSGREEPVVTRKVSYPCNL